MRGMYAQNEAERRLGLLLFLLALALGSWLALALGVEHWPAPALLMPVAVALYFWPV